MPEDTSPPRVPEAVLKFLQQQGQSLLQGGRDEEVERALKVLSETMANHQRVVASLSGDQPPGPPVGGDDSDLDAVMQSLNDRLETVSKAIDEADPTTLALLQGGLPRLLRDQALGDPSTLDPSNSSSQLAPDTPSISVKQDNASRT